MAKISLLFAVLLAALGVGSYVATGSQHPTALIPLWFGLALGLFGWLAISPNESRRKLFMHINVTIALVGVIGAGWRAIHSYMAAQAAGTHVDSIAVGAQVAMAVLLAVYVVMCVRSFISARRTGLV